MKLKPLLISVLVATVLGLVTLSIPSFAQELTLAGRWKAGPMVAKWRVGEWGKACGPEPSGGGDAGGTALIVENGSELTITGSGRTFATTQCWQEYPGVNRASHSAGKRSWQNVCKTSAKDPRQATLKTRISATDNSISFEETGQYQFVIQGQNCTASSGHWRTYTLLQRAGEPEAPAANNTAVGGQAGRTATPKAAETSASNERCKKPGEPARLEVRPSRKLMRFGETFQFRAVVLDNNGCVLGAKPKWTLVTRAPYAALSAQGELALTPEAPEGEVKIRAEVGGNQVDVVAEVASKERYDALLSGGGFDEAGEVAAAASVAIAGASIGAAAVEAKDDAGRRKMLFVALVGTIALLLGAGGAFVFMRTRKAHKRQLEAQSEAHQRALAEHESAKQKAERERAELIKAQELAAKQAAEKTKQMICPLCGQIFPGNTKFCGKDGTVLLPVN